MTITSADDLGDELILYAKTRSPKVVTCAGWLDAFDFMLAIATDGTEQSMPAISTNRLGANGLSMLLQVFSANRLDVHVSAALFPIFEYLSFCVLDEGRWVSLDELIMCCIRRCDLADQIDVEINDESVRIHSRGNFALPSGEMIDVEMSRISPKWRLVRALSDDAQFILQPTR